jgi:pyruvate dehydrogenase E1 component
VPIVPDEARTFGMEALFRQVGIYSHAGQVYEPVDMDTLLYYKEASDGQILEEGITEAGSMSSFIAAGTAYATHGVNTIPFFIYYSMFGFQRIGDLIWAAGDSRTRGFLLGGTVGPDDARRRRAAAPGRQQPPLCARLPELPRLRPGVRLRNRRHRRGRHPPDVHRSGKRLLLPDGDERAVRDAGHARRRARGILKGLYRFRTSSKSDAPLRAQLFGSGAILTEVIKAQEVLESKYNVGADVWSVTSYSELYRDGHACERWNMLHPGEQPRVPYVTRTLEGAPGVFVAASDYVKAMSDTIDRWVPTPVTVLGTDGFGRSENRAGLREFFEVDYRTSSSRTLAALARDGS